MVPKLHLHPLEGSIGTVLIEKAKELWDGNKNHVDWVYHSVDGEPAREQSHTQTTLTEHSYNSRETPDGQKAVLQPHYIKK